jgi:hypothetical protein
VKIPIFMIFQFFGVISAWASKALADGKVTAAEGFELIVALAGILGVQLDFDVSDYMPTAVGIAPVDEDLQSPDDDTESRVWMKPEE